MLTNRYWNNSKYFVLLFYWFCWYFYYDYYKAFLSPADGSDLCPGARTFSFRKKTIASCCPLCLLFPCGLVALQMLIPQPAFPSWHLHIHELLPPILEWAEQGPERELCWRGQAVKPGLSCQERVTNCSASPLICFLLSCPLLEVPAGKHGDAGFCHRHCLASVSSWQEMWPVYSAVAGGWCWHWRPVSTITWPSGLWDIPFQHLEATPEPSETKQESEVIITAHVALGNIVSTKLVPSIPQVNVREYWINDFTHSFWSEWCGQHRKHSWGL